VIFIDRNFINQNVLDCEEEIINCLQDLENMFDRKTVGDALENVYQGVRYNQII